MEFLHCLRIQFVPGLYEEERIENAVQFCKTYGFRNVMLFINSEEYNVGHMTKEEAAPWVETMLRAKRRFTENGISVSLNPWMEAGHLDRCRTLKPGQDFITMEDFNGKKCTMVACPLDENWRIYFADFYTYLLQTLRSEVVWVEDDFRLHNHGELEYGGCFCPLHMKRYNEKLGTNYTREEFREKLFGKNADEAAQRAWLDVSRETMSDFAAFLGNTVKAAGTGARVGLMSSTAESHAMEARDWTAIAEGLAQGKEKIHRIHLPCYIETTGKDYLFLFNRTSMAVRTFLPEDSLIYPELENGAFSTFIKDARFLRFQVESAIPLVLSGMTYDIYDFVGNGTIPEFGYGEAVKSITPYLNGVLSLGIRFSDLTGVLLPIDERTVYNRREIAVFEDFRPDEFYAGAYLASFGIACKYTKEKKFFNQTVALFGGAADNFSDEQLKDLFANNFVLLEGGTALRLVKRGLGGLIFAKSAERIPYETTLLSYEQTKGRVCGVKNRRASSFGKAGDYVKIEYGEGAEILSETFDNTQNFFGNGIARGKNFLLNPYVMNDFEGEQFNPTRTGILQSVLEEEGRETIMSGRAGVCCYHYKGAYGRALMIVNGTVENFSQIELTAVNVPVKEFYAVNRQSGAKEKIAFVQNGNKLKIDFPLEYLSTATFIFR